jgi:hypothetical protein
MGVPRARAHRRRSLWVLACGAVLLAACMSDFDDDDHSSPRKDSDITAKADAKAEGGEAGAGGYCIGAGCDDEGLPPPGGDPPTEGGVATCEARGCAQAEDLGSIAGDMGGDDVRSRQGSGSAWFKIHVAEQYYLGADMKVSATLVSPQGANYDVALYESNTCGGEAIMKSTQPAGTTDNATDEWIDFPVSDDSRDFLIEVKHVSGSCEGSGKWTLLVSGG